MKPTDASALPRATATLPTMPTQPAIGVSTLPRPTQSTGPARLLHLFASLKLTVVLLFLSIGLIFFGTLAQTTNGIWQVMELYFRSFYVAVPLGLLVPGNVGADIPGVLPWPGGATLGALLFINLIVAHALRYTMVARGQRLALGIVITLVGVAAIAVAFFVPAVNHALVDHGVVPLFAVGSLFFIPLLIGAWLLYGKRYGIVLIHSSLVLLLAGEFVTALVADEGQMPIYEGQSLNWVQDIRTAELAIMVPAVGPFAIDGYEGDPSELRRTVAISEPKLARLGDTNETYNLPGLDLALRVDQFMPNAALFRRSPNTAVAPQATAGLGVDFVYAQPADEVSGVGEMRVDQPAAIVSLLDPKTGDTHARLLVATGLEPPDQPYRPIHQNIDTPVGPVEVAMRFERTYLPYAVGLGEFRHDLYPGTQVPKNFSSDVVIANQAGDVERTALIRMNEPLRFAGKTFFQSGWIPGPENLAGTDRGTVLQVVNNPGWTVPYIACIVGGLGLTVHFCLGLIGYLQRRRTEANVKATRVRTDTQGNLTNPSLNPWPLRPTALATLAGLALAASLLWPTPRYDTLTDRGMDADRFGQIAVSYDGRFKPWDAVARDTLTAIAGRDVVERDGQRIHPVAWMLDAVTQPESRTDEVFRIDHPQVKRLIGVTDLDRKRFAYNEIQPHLDELSRLSQQAAEVEAKDRDPFERAVLDLGDHVALYQGIVSMTAPHAVALDDANGQTGENWVPLPDAVARIAATGQFPEQAALLGQAIKAYDDGDAALFTRATYALRNAQADRFPDIAAKAQLETAFNAFGPFTRTAGLYVAAGIAVALSWLFAPGPLRRVALVLLLVAFVVHTLALGVRVHLSGRPPVTNLYGSAVFVGWGVVMLGLLLEPITKLGLGYATAAVAGVTTLLVARGLDDGDTMNVLQAVLDTNFWLATHVIVITLGYSAMFVAALIGAAYLLIGVYTKALNRAKDRRAIEAGMFGVTCFALLLSFVGTILGGIWADQSWGRFWGWDPKENGAMMIVLWGAIIIHARLAKMIAGPGLASLCVLGAVITLWSWFGTNMLGVGLHSYGFMDSAVFWMLVAVAILVAVASVALIPTRRWASFTS